MEHGVVAAIVVFEGRSCHLEERLPAVAERQPEGAWVERAAMGKEQVQGRGSERSLDAAFQSRLRCHQRALELRLSRAHAHEPEATNRLLSKRHSLRKLRVLDRSLQETALAPTWPSG